MFLLIDNILYIYYSDDNFGFRVKNNEKNYDKNRVFDNSGMRRNLGLSA